ncbi:MAG: hypothetical protein IH958_05395 [Chloroflexi bacterium]|nr:hypothetical protein [Chloroflexota bacterium]
MVRRWSAEIGDAKRIIEPLVREADPIVEVQINGGEGFRKETVEVRLRKSGREALCIVTFEAWANARTDPAKMIEYFEEVIRDIEGGDRLPSYLLTSKRLAREEAQKEVDVLRDIAASKEADVLAEQFFKRGRG